MTTKLSAQEVKARAYLKAHPNPKSRHQALSTALHMTGRGIKVPANQCDHLVAVDYGWSHSGEVSATAHMEHLQKLGFLVKPVDKWATNCWAGDLIFWTHPKHPFGHVALQGPHDRLCYSPDIVQKGVYSLVPITMITEKWGYTLRGTTAPIFPRGIK